MTQITDIKHVYKLIDPTIIPRIKQSGFVPPSALDVADGFMHLSTQEQYIETANLHYKDFAQIYALEIEITPFLPFLKWEAAKKRNNALFPHLYTELPASAITKLIPLIRHDDARFSAQSALPPSPLVV